MTSDLATGSRKPAPKQKKTYGKNVKSHISGWFGRDLWSAVEPVDSAGKKTKEQKKEKSKRQSVEEDVEVDVEKQLAREAEEEGLKRIITAGEDEKRKVEVGVKTTIEIAEVRTDLEIPGTPEHEELEAGILALLEGVKKIDMSSSASETPSSPITQRENDRNSNSSTKSLKENSDKENDEPPFPTLGSRRVSRKKSPDSSAHPSPREALKERSISPEREPEQPEVLIESPARKNGVRKKGSLVHRRSANSPISSPLKREPTTPLGFPNEKVDEKEDEREDIKVWEDLESGSATPVKPKQPVYLKAENKSRDRISPVETLDSRDELAQKLSKVKFVGEPSRNAEKASLAKTSNVVDHVTSSKETTTTGTKPTKAKIAIPEEGYGSDDSELTALGDQEEGYYYPEDLPVDELLSFCTVPKVLDFAEHIDTLLLQSTIRKLGEASYSEVFLQIHQSDPFATTSLPTVLKIIPFGGPDQCKLSSIIQEVSITKSMATIDGFIGFCGAYAVRGAFPEKLMDEWDAYEEERGSENERPEFYDEGQLFAIIMLEMGGTDLEHFDLNGWEEAGDVFWQVAIALAVGEREREFEHRDLHFGNIVIRRESGYQPRNCEEGNDEEDQEPENLLSKLSIEDDGAPIMSHLKVSLIDYTLSRAICGTLDTDSDIQFAPLDDSALFTGKGDYQFDIYRFMRAHVSSGLVPPEEEDIDWNVYAPRTNVFWLHYLTNILLNKKGISRPAARGRNAASEGEKKAYKDLEAVAKCIDPRKKRFGGKCEIRCAGELVDWAIAEGMLKVGIWGDDEGDE